MVSQVRHYVQDVARYDIQPVDGLYCYGMPRFSQTLRDDEMVSDPYKAFVGVFCVNFHCIWTSHDFLTSWYHALHSIVHINDPCYPALRSCSHK